MFYILPLQEELRVAFVKASEMIRKSLILDLSPEKKHILCPLFWLVAALTNGWFDQDWLSLIRVVAVSCSTHRLHPKHILLLSLETMDRKPEEEGWSSDTLKDQSDLLQLHVITGDISPIRLCCIYYFRKPPKLLCLKIYPYHLVLVMGLLLTVFQACLPASL